MPLVIGIDIGGTKIAGGVVDSCGTILAKYSCPSYGSLGRDKILEGLGIAISKLLSKSPAEISAIGIGTAGEVDPESGIVTSATANIPKWAGMELKKYVQSLFQLPTFVDNDGNAAALAEHWYGAGREFRELIYLCLGTGVGGAIISNGRLFRGTRNFAGAIGHMAIDHNGRPCNCGSRGCLEAYVSGTAIGLRAQEAHLELDSKALFSQAAAGNNEARALVTAIAYDLGCGLANLVNLFDPEAIIVGGGVSEVGEMLLGPAREVMESRVLQGLRNKVALLPAKYRGDSGLLGGAVLAMGGLGLNQERELPHGN